MTRYVLALTYQTGPETGQLALVGPFGSVEAATTHRTRFGPARSLVYPLYDPDETAREMEART